MSDATLVLPENLEYVVGIDVGMETCWICCLTRDKQQIIKPGSFPNDASGFAWLFAQLEQLPCPPVQILVGLEATSRYAENLLHAVSRRGYHLCLLHPGQMHAFAQQRGLRAQTDQVDARTIARALLSDEIRVGYVPSEEVATYRELVRLQQQLTDEIARSKNEIHPLLVVLFPEFTQVFADPTRKSALVVLKAYPSAQAFSEADLKQLTHLLRRGCPGRYGEQTASKLIQLAKESISSGVARKAREICLRTLCDQLEHTQANLEQVEAQIEQLVESDDHLKGVRGRNALGTITVAVLRAELGDVQRFARMDQIVAYAGLDLRVKQSGKWKGQVKLSKHGSGLLRRMLYLAAWRSIRQPTSPFGEYYQRLVQRGMKKGMAVVAIMRKLWIVAAHLMATQQEHDAGKVGAAAVSSSRQVFRWEKACQHPRSWKTRLPPGRTSVKTLWPFLHESIVLFTFCSGMC